MIGSCERCGVNGVSLRHNPRTEAARPTLCDRCHAEAEEELAREREREQRTSWTPSEREVREARSELCVTTRGVTSHVGAAVEDESGERRTRGHVTLLDADGTDRLAVEQLAAGMSGVTALFLSSPGSYHLWNLTVRGFEEAILEGLSCRVADPQHVAQSYRRGCYVVRVAPKVGDDGAVYKDAPELLSVHAGSELSAVPTSRPHLDLLELRANESGDAQLIENVASMREEATLVGGEDGLEVHSYMTLTDGGKDEVAGRD
jgi:hypothetical protein